MALRLTLLLPLVLLAAGCGADDETGGPGSIPPKPLAQLVVRVDADGKGAAPAKELRIRCESAGESPACSAADALKPADFAPVPADKACTQIFGGPQTASVTGSLRGEDVDGGFSRQNGCEVARWEAVAALLDQVK